MKVIVYFNSMLPAGGIERVISQHIYYMVESYEVILLTKDSGNSFYHLPHSLSKLSLGIGFGMNMSSRFLRLLKICTTLISTVFSIRMVFRVQKPDIVYVATPLNLLEVFLSGLSLRNVVITEHAAHSSYNKIYKFFINFLYPKVRLLTIPTKSDSLFYKSQGIANEYLPNPVAFYPRSYSQVIQKVALCVGRLTDDKRHDLLIDIWNISNIDRLGWRLIIVGNGENEEFLKEKIKKLGLENSITINKPTPNIEELYVSSSIFLLASRAEGFGLVLAEAMACGLPCISFDCPNGPRDIINNGSTGWLIPDGDIYRYVEALRQLSLDIHLRKEFGFQGKIRAKKFESSLICNQFLHLLKDKFQ